MGKRFLRRPMASCGNTVLTGQEGLIQFKPLGTTNCVDDCYIYGRPHLPALRS